MDLLALPSGDLVEEGLPDLGRGASAVLLGWGTCQVSLVLLDPATGLSGSRTMKIEVP